MQESERYIATHTHTHTPYSHTHTHTLACESDTLVCSFFGKSLENRLKRSADKPVAKARKNEWRATRCDGSSRGEREVVIGEGMRSVGGSGLWGWVNFWVFIGFVSVELQQNILSSLESAGRACVCVCWCLVVCVCGCRNVGKCVWKSAGVWGRGKLTYQLRAQKKS